MKLNAAISALWLCWAIEEYVEGAHYLAGVYACIALANATIELSKYNKQPKAGDIS